MASTKCATIICSLQRTLHMQKDVAKQLNMRGVLSDADLLTLRRTYLAIGTELKQMAEGHEPENLKTDG